MFHSLLPSVHKQACKFPCGEEWTKCPIGGTGPSPPCPADSPTASFAVPSDACEKKCRDYIEPICAAVGYTAACFSQPDPPGVDIEHSMFLNLEAQCLTGGGGHGAAPPTLVSLNRHEE